MQMKNRIATIFEGTNPSWKLSLPRPQWTNQNHRVFNESGASKSKMEATFMTLIVNEKNIMSSIPIFANRLMPTNANSCTPKLEGIKLGAKVNALIIINILMLSNADMLSFCALTIKK